MQSLASLQTPGGNGGNGGSGGKTIFPWRHFPSRQFTSSFVISLASPKYKPSHIQTTNFNSQIQIQSKDCITKEQVIIEEEALQNVVTVREKKKTSLRDVFSIANCNLKISNLVYFDCK